MTQGDTGIGSKLLVDMKAKPEHSVTRQQESKGINMPVKQEFIYIQLGIRVVKCDQVITKINPKGKDELEDSPSYVDRGIFNPSSLISTTFFKAPVYPGSSNLL